MVMKIYSHKILEKKVILTINRRICETPEELLSSELFYKILVRCISRLSKRGSVLLNIFDNSREISEDNISLLIDTLKSLVKIPIKLVPDIIKGTEKLTSDTNLLNDFVEYLYNYWRSFDRFILCSSEYENLDKRPYRTFNETVEKLTHLVRFTYRNIQENITGNHPRVYRQVRAGSELAAITPRKTIPMPGGEYQKIKEIQTIRQVLLYPPLVLNPPMNKRTGQFDKVTKNPLELININRDEWVCYPAKVGKLLILIYFQNKFFELGFSLCNLFEIASDDEIKKVPDAIYFFGVPDGQLDIYGKNQTVFFEDTKNNIMVAAVPDRDEFGYFGYLKKMVLTLHNIKTMRDQKFPFHGALFRLNLKGRKDMTVLIIGDTGAGKSETIEALRIIGKEYISDLQIIADDMGSIEMDLDEQLKGFGTEIGAFLRLDDLQPGYAFGQIDRAIIMSASQINSRIVLPVNSYNNIIKGYKIDYILYANNYETIDDEHPVIERIQNPEDALKIFKEGTVMSKGTTTSTGLTHSYFANIFGPPQYKGLHEKIAEKYFNAFFEKGIFVGQIRTRLGIKNFETDGPKEAALKLLKTICI
jgi:energy-coupling factor transporter ATP-binding protein EcfA2